MIKINLLPQKRPKRDRAGAGLAARGGGDASSNNSFIIGVVAVLAYFAIGFFVVDKPRRDELNDLRDKTEKLQGDLAAIKQKLGGGSGDPSYAELQKSIADAQNRATAINRLMAAKIVPANVLHELNVILTPRRHPTMTKEMLAKVASDPAKAFDDTWDPNHVELTSFTDTAGSFKLEGRAQKEEDVEQLWRRLSASIYFIDAAPATGEHVADAGNNSVPYYKFSITGRLAY